MSLSDVSSGFYERQLMLLAGVCLTALAIDNYVSARRHQAASNPIESAEQRFEAGLVGSSASYAMLSRKYLVVYAIVVGADWLQGPYFYSIYRQQYAYPERIVALFFVTGSLSAGMAAPLIGVWADQYGRKKLCLAFCILYGVSCVCILIPYLPILLIGRVLGGTSACILSSAFESWLISSASSLALPQADLSTIMGRASLLNGFVATGAGVLSDRLVATTGSYATPFVASGLLLWLGYVVIKRTWIENYGGSSGTEQDVFQLKRLAQAWRIVRNDPLLIVLGLTATCFEGSVSLFVFVWVPALQEAAASHSLPLGYVFSSFMICIMLGAILYTVISTVLLHTNSASLGESSAASLGLHAKLSSLICAASGLALACSVASEDEHVRFWAFCAFEVCVGMFYPVQGMLRGILISNEHRATLSSLFRVPLSIFVVVSLLTGVASARYAVLTASTLMLALSSLITGAIIVNRADEPGKLEFR